MPLIPDKRSDAVRMIGYIIRRLDRRGDRHDRRRGDHLPAPALALADARPTTCSGPRPAAPRSPSWNKQHGYDRPEIAQFLSYLGNLVHLNFGYSYKLSQSVSALFKENAGRSAYLSGAALVLSLLIAIPLGILQAVKRNSSRDYTPRR